MAASIAFRTTPAWIRAAVGLCFAPPLGLLAAVLAMGVLAAAQPVRVGTEFVRYTPAGEVFPQDSAVSPMEALSPPLVRGMWNSFRIVVEVEPEDVFRLFLAQNPENAMQTRVFREVVSRGPEGWRVERRALTPLPFRNTALPQEARIPGQRTYTFWLDVRPPADYPSQRLKLEAQILSRGQWFIHPMEIRVIDLQLPSAPPGQADLPEASIGARATDLLHREVLRRFVCAAPDAQGQTVAVAPGKQGSLEAHAARAYDFMLDAVARQEGRDAVRAIVDRFLGVREPAAWCRNPTFPTAKYGPEWPNAVRNQLLRLRGNPVE